MIAPRSQPIPRARHSGRPMKRRKKRDSIPAAEPIDYTELLPLSRTTRNRIVEAHPEATEGRQILLRLAAHLETGVTCRFTHKPLMAGAILAGIEGKQREYATGHYSASAMLELCQQLDPEITFNEAIWSKGRARTANTSMEQVDLYREYVSGELVDRETGAEYDPEVIRERVISASNEHTATILKYLNSKQGRELATLYEERIPLAIEAAGQIEDAKARNNAMRNLLMMQILPFPEYREGKNSPRAYMTTAGVQYLDSNLRAIIFEGNVMLDLRSAQLTVLSSPDMLDVPELQQFLQDGGNFWHELGRSYGVHETDAEFPVFKKAMKRALNTITYGGKEHTARGAITRIGGWKWRKWDGKVVVDGERNYDPEIFINHPLIQKVLEARDRKMAELLEQGTFTKGNGETYRLTEDKVSKSDTEYMNVKTAFAYGLQMGEVKLIAPLYEAAQKEREGLNRYEILAHFHDGVALRVHRDEDREAVIAELTAVVDKRAAELNIVATLEAEVVSVEKKITARTEARICIDYFVTKLSEEYDLVVDEPPAPKHIRQIQNILDRYGLEKVLQVMDFVFAFWDSRYRKRVRLPSRQTKENRHRRGALRRTPSFNLFTSTEWMSWFVHDLDNGTDGRYDD